MQKYFFSPQSSTVGLLRMDASGKRNKCDRHNTLFYCSFHLFKFMYVYVYIWEKLRINSKWGSIPSRNRRMTGADMLRVSNTTSRVASGNCHTMLHLIIAPGCELMQSPDEGGTHI